MFSNDSKRIANAQSRPRRSDLIESAKQDWFTRAKELLQKKDSLGYESFSWDSFLEIDSAIDDALALDKQSKIIELQDEYRELKKHREHVWAEDNAIDELNKKHAVVHAEQTYILTEKENNLGGSDFSLESRQSFKAFYEDEEILCIDGIYRSKADIWLKSPRRKKYHSVVFDPTIIGSSKDAYNLWKGFTRSAQQGDCNLYWKHVRDNICNSDENHYQYVRKWLASVFQHPDKVHTALVLCGSQGVGKNSFVEPLGTLLGTHFAPLSSIAELVSNFNYHLKNAVIIHANEALWGGHKKEIGTVKAMITESTCLIEGKGKDRIVVRNFKHIILSSNEDWPVHMDADDRRFFVLRVSEAQKENADYFKALQEELNYGGYEALLYDLLNEPLDGFEPRKIPSSDAAFEIKMRSADSPTKYLYEALLAGGWSIGINDTSNSPAWQADIPKDAIFNDYRAWCASSEEFTQNKEALGKAIKKYLPSTAEFRTGGTPRMRCFRFTSLDEAQKEFARSFKTDANTIFCE